MNAKLPFALLAAAIITGCHHEPPAPPPQLPPAEVQLAVAAIGTNRAVEQVVGTVRARTVAFVSAKISGRIETLKTAIGQRVKAGELLAEIDAAEIAARLEQAEAGLENAQRELDRYRKLLAQKAVTQSEFDAVESRHRIAAASVTEAKTMLGYTKVKSPFDGVIARKLADIGDLAAPGKPLLELDSSGGLRFESDISEALASRIQLGDQLKVVIDGIAQPITANVAEIAPAANPLSRTLPVKLDLPDTKGLRAGQFGRLTIPVEAGANVRVPASAVVQRGQMEIIFVARENQSQLRLVKSGKRFGDQIEILSGIEDGEPVVTAGNDSLKDGQPLIAK